MATDPIQGWMLEEGGGWSVEEDAAPKGPRSFGQRFKDAFTDASQYGGPGVTARKVHDWINTSKDELRKRNPTASEDELEAMSDDVVSRAQREIREQGAARQAADPAWRGDEGFLDNILAIDRWFPTVAGNVLGSAGPENLLMPGGGAIGRIAGQGAISGASDAGYQASDVQDDVADEFSVGQNLGAIGAGAAFQGGLEGMGAIISKLRGAKTEGEARAIIEEAQAAKTPAAPEGQPLPKNDITDDAYVDPEGALNFSVTDESMSDVDHILNSPEPIIEGKRYNEPEQPGELHPWDAEDPGIPVKTSFERGLGMDDRMFSRYQRRLAEERRVAEEGPPEGMDERRMIDRREAPEEELGTDDTIDFGSKGIQDVRTYEPDEIEALIARREGNRQAQIDAMARGEEVKAPPPVVPEEVPVVDEAGLMETLSRQPKGELLDPEQLAQQRFDEQPVEMNSTRDPSVDRDKYIGGINTERLDLDEDSYWELDDVLRRSGKPRESLDAVKARTLNVLKSKSPEEILSHDPKLSEASEYAYATRLILKDSLKRQNALAKSALDPSADKTALKEQMLLMRLRIAAAAEKASGQGTEAGRLLNSFKATVGKGDKRMLAALAKLDNNIDPEKYAQKVLELHNNPEAQEKLAKDSLKKHAEDYLFSLWYNWGLLSHPATHTVNMLGSAGNIFMDVLERGVGAAFGLDGKIMGRTDRILGREVAANLYGALAGIKQGFLNAPKAFVAGVPLDNVHRMADNVSVMPGASTYALEAPTRSMAAQDEFFRSIAASMQLYGSAMRKAALEDNPGNLRQQMKRAGELVDDPTEEMLKEAADVAQRLQFRDAPSPIGRAVEKVKRKNAGDNGIQRTGRSVAKIFFPFVSTVDSLVRTAIRRSPAGFLDRVNQADWVAGGARKDAVKARMAVGSGIAATVALWSANGMITGSGPKQYQKRQELESSGWRPNSFKSQWDFPNFGIKKGDYISYQGLEPLAINFNVISSLVERHKSGEGDEDSYVEGVRGAISNTLAALVDNSYTEGFAQMAQMLDPRMGESATENWLAGLAASMTTPGIVRAVTQTEKDREYRDTTGDGSVWGKTLDRIKSGWPGLSEELPQSYDVLGRPRSREEAVGPNIMSRMSISPEEVDEAANEIFKTAGEKVLVGPVESKINVGEDVPRRQLTSEEKQNYQRLAGQYILETVREEMKTPEWGVMTDEEKRKEIKDIAEDMRKIAREELFVPKGEDEQWSIEGEGKAKPKQQAASGSPASPAPVSSGVQGAERIAESLGLKVTDGLRTRKEQEYLYANYRGVAKPGTSGHELGNSIDVRPKKGVTPKTVMDKLSAAGYSNVRVITKRHGTGRHWHFQWGPRSAPKAVKPRNAVRPQPSNDGWTIEG